MKLNSLLVLFGSISALCASHIVAAAPQPVTGAMRAELERRDAEMHSALQERQAQGLVAVGVGVYAFIAGLSAGETVLGAIANAMTAAFGGKDTPWTSGDNCQISFSTKGGAHCKAKTKAAPSSGNTTTDANTHNNWNVCPWIDPANTDPPVQYFTDPGIGFYSIRFTATDKYTWGGASNTHKCPAEGLCNPQITFYRDGYNIILNTWESIGDPTEGGYTGDFHGLCGNQNGVVDQFSEGGNTLGNNCAIPCWNQGSLPSTEG